MNVIFAISYISYNNSYLDALLTAYLCHTRDTYMSRRKSNILYINTVYILGTYYNIIQKLVYDCNIYFCKIIKLLYFITNNCPGSIFQALIVYQFKNFLSYTKF